MKKRLIVLVALFTAPACFAALTQEQKVTDFLTLAGLYNRSYAPRAWKFQAFGFDLANLDSWMTQVKASTSDLQFYDICVRYVASFNDFHSNFTLPVIYEAGLPLTLDVYDGKVLIDAIDNTALDPKQYPINIGDELVSLNGVSAADWITALGPYAVNGHGNPVSGSRLAAAAIADRYQGFYTYASQTQPGDVATLVIRTNGGLATYKIAWLAGGIPLTQDGPLANPSHGALTFKSLPPGQAKKSLRERAAASANRWGQWTGDPAPRKHSQHGPKSPQGTALVPATPVAGSITPFGSPFPKFNPPPGFQLRLGAAQTDAFLSGTFQAGNSLVGFIRIPNLNPPDELAALQQFQGEIAYFQQNTAALVIDIMSDGGGAVCYTNNLLQYLFPSGFPALGFAPMATQFWVEYLTQYREYNRSIGQLQLVPVYSALIQQTQQALRTHSLAPPLNVCTGSLSYPAASDASGHNLAFTKPILLLTDNFTGSSAEFFAATLQDNGRAFVYGTRTSGGGAEVFFYPEIGTPYSEGSTSAAVALAIRNKTIQAPGLPAAPLIENIGILPDVTADFQTKDNLLTGGATFIQGFVATITRIIANGHP